MTTLRLRTIAAAAIGFTCLLLTSCSSYDPNIKDEAASIRDNPKLGPKALPQDERGTLYPTHPDDAFKGMDSHVKDVYGHEFTEDEIKGRNTWVMWSGGNQEFWDYLSRNSNGIVDLLKLCDSRFVRRADRFPIIGIVPHPGMVEVDPTQDLGKPSESNHYGLHLDAYDYGDGSYGDEGGDDAYDDDKAENGGGDDRPRAYVEGRRPDPAVYGYASGIVGLRLFPRATDPNPEVRKEWERNRHKWDPKRYVSDESYYKDPSLIRPYRVGMSCGFCHISANPMNPPKEMHNASWSNLSSNIGSQYFWFGRVFGTDFKRDNLLYYLINYAEPGSLDTSLVATDGNNNPNTMNSVYQLLPRIIVSLKSPAEQTPSDTLKYMPRLDQGYSVPDGRAAGTIVDDDPKGANDVRPLRFTDAEQSFLGYLGLNDPETGKPLDRLPPLGDAKSRHTPKVLVDGADSIGGRAALCRVYLNIGEYGQEWRQLHNTMVGITPQRPFKMSRAAVDSVNWNVTMRRSTNLAKYFLAGSVPMRLEDAPGVKAIPHPKKQQNYKQQSDRDEADDDDDDYDDDEDDDDAAEQNDVKTYGSYVLPNNHKDVIRGAEVFARDCFVCHSSLGQPEGFWADAANWKKWIQQPDYVEQASDWLVGLLKEEVTVRPVDEWKDKLITNDPFFEEFVKENYLSTDARYHVSDIGTNTGRALADNGSNNTRMWADYSSIDFKNQVKKATPVEIAHPYDPDRTITWPLNTEAGPGRYRPHSLSSMWAHGPYLHNNSVGYYPYEYGPDPRPGQEGQVLSTLAPGIQSVESRVGIFEDGTRRLLGLESEPQGYDHAKDYRGFTSKPRRGFDSIVRFQDNAALELPSVVVPDAVYMQSLALIGIGIPRWVLVLLLLGLLVIAIVLFVKGGRRIHEGRGSLLRNVAAIAIGLVLVGTVLTLWQKETYRVGYIPKGTPVNLVANLNGPKWITSSPRRKKLLPLALIGLLKAEKHKVSSLAEVTVHERPLVDILMELSKCPDLVLDKGHEFGEYNTLELAKGRREKVPEADREALIEFLKKL